MTITVGSRQIADGIVQSVGLQPVMGAYELAFSLRLSVPTGQGGLPRASVLGARITVQSSEGDVRPLGFARPQQPFQLVCKDFVDRPSCSLHLSLHPGQIAALEELRDSGELTFQLWFAGTGMDDHGEQYLHGELSGRVPRSDWLQTLRAAGARNVLLLEVPMPLEEDQNDGWSAVASHLRSAEEAYGTGNYRECVASCRLVFDELGTLCGLKWPHELRRDMAKPEREDAAFGALRHYTHLAHHTIGGSGEASFTRSEAQFILSATAAAVRLAQVG